MHRRRTVASVAQHDSFENESLKRDKKNPEIREYKKNSVLLRVEISSNCQWQVKVADQGNAYIFVTTEGLRVLRMNDGTR